MAVWLMIWLLPRSSFFSSPDFPFSYYTQASLTWHVLSFSLSLSLSLSLFFPEGWIGWGCTTYTLFFYLNYSLSLPHYWFHLIHQSPFLNSLAKWFSISTLLVLIMAFITKPHIYYLFHIDYKLHESRKLSVIFTNIYSVLAKSLV